jgi:hypothetical protein
MNPRVRWFEFLRAGQADQECEKERQIYDAQHRRRLPGHLVLSEGDEDDEGAPATDDTAVKEAYNGLGATFDLFL